MTRYRRQIDTVSAHVRSLWIVIGLLVLMLSGALLGWSQAPRHVTLHIPPDLRSGGSLQMGEVSPANVYAFTHYIFQQLNHWPEDGAKDYGKRIYAMAPYLTPRFIEDLKRELNSKGRRGELAGRMRSVVQVPGEGYEERRVDVLGNGVWVVWLDLNLEEVVKGLTIKETTIRYPIRVIQRLADPERNPWGLELDGYAEAPARLDTHNDDVATRLTREQRG